MLVVWPGMWEECYNALRNVLALGLGWWTEFSRLSKHWGCQKAEPDKSPKNTCKAVNYLIGWRGWIWEIRARDDLEGRIWKRLQIICLLNKGTWILFMIRGLFSKGELGNNARVEWARSRTGWAAVCAHGDAGKPSRAEGKWWGTAWRREGRRIHAKGEAVKVYTTTWWTME